MTPTKQSFQPYMPREGSYHDMNKPRETSLWFPHFKGKGDASSFTQLANILGTMAAHLRALQKGSSMGTDKVSGVLTRKQWPWALPLGQLTAQSIPETRGNSTALVALLKSDVNTG